MMRAIAAERDAAIKDRDRLKEEIAKMVEDNRPHISLRESYAIGRTLRYHTSNTGRRTANRIGATLMHCPQDLSNKPEGVTESLIASLRPGGNSVLTFILSGDVGPQFLGLGVKYYDDEMQIGYSEEIFTEGTRQLLGSRFGSDDLFH